MQNDTVISTKAGVNALGDPAGTVTVIDEDGSTQVGLDVEDGTGTRVLVYLDYYQVTALMVALGAAAAKL